MLLYVAGPLTTSGMLWTNVRRACEAGDRIRELGHFAYIPHLNAFWAMATTEAETTPESAWLAHCFEVVRRCDGMLRLPGESRGADQEVKLARELGIPVYGSTEEIPRETQHNPFADAAKALQRALLSLPAAVPDPKTFDKLSAAWGLCVTISKGLL